MTTFRWTAGDIEYFNGNACYGNRDCSDAILKYKRSVIDGRRGMVFATQSPWAESLLVKANASMVFTYEYAVVKSSHPRVVSGTPSHVAKQYLNGEWAPYDFGFSYSSFEHDGLGRYGDPLNPYGDIESVTKIACLTKPGSVLFFAVPVSSDGLTFNAHRIYGRIRLPLILAAWELVDVVGKYNLDGPSVDTMNQPILVLVSIL